MAGPAGARRHRLIRAAPTGLGPLVLDDPQRAVVEHPGGPLLVLAGPGTGKTTTLVEAVAARVERGVEPGRILVLTFSRQAARELRDRIAGRLGRTTVTPLASTFHGFCHALLTAVRDGTGPPLRVLSGPEQEVAVRELLRGSIKGPQPVRWPKHVAAAIGTKGLAEELIDVLTRIGEHDIDLRSLAEVDAGGRELWEALAQFAECYLDVIDARNMLDHAGLIRRALLWAEAPRGRAALRARYDVVFVDEYQDVGPAQTRLLEALAGDGRDLVVFGDPDQSIYGFRGADVRQILEFADHFRTTAGTRAPVRSLSVFRRGTPALSAAARELASRLPLTGLDAASARAHRASRVPEQYAGADLPESGPPGVDVCTFPSVGAELAHVAEFLRRAHLADGLPWSQMAVLVRAGERDLPNVRRLLAAAGVPVSMPVNEVPLRLQPAVATLLTVLQVVLEPGSMRPETARALLLSPLAGLDPMQVRSLGRALRAAAVGTDRVAGAAELISDALLDPDRSAGLGEPSAETAHRFAQLLSAAIRIHQGGGRPDEVLWHLWSGTGWPGRLERAAGGVGPVALRADRDLDAVCALFTRAEEVGENRGGQGLRALLESLAVARIPEEPTSVRRQADAVTLITAHRAKGLEWPLVVIVGVQEGVWPDLRRRGTLLGADRITAEGLAPVPSRNAALAEERRLFYVAVTRARSRLLVTAVDATDSDGERPSRFLNELGVLPRAEHGHPRRPLSAAALVGELRAALIDEGSSPGLRAAAAQRLALLAETRAASGVALAPGAAPETWWGLLDPTQAPAPIRDPDLPVELSPSAVDGLAGCPLRWFLRREVQAASAPGSAAAFGTVVHALAEEMSTASQLDPDVLDARLEAAWDTGSFEAIWQLDQHKRDAREALERFSAWQSSRPDRAVLGVEVPFEVDLDAAGTAVRLRGRIDRVERDAAGHLHLIDLKTSRTSIPLHTLAGHPQLAAYQAAVRAGALQELPGADAPLAGAELVMLRQPDRAGVPKVHSQPAAGHSEESDRFAARLGELADRVRAELFAPKPSPDCDRCEFRRCCSGRAEGRGVVE